MDPISAIAFAGTILTFIDFTHKLVSGALEVADTGAIAGHRHISAVVDDLQKVTKDISNNEHGLDRGGSGSGHFEALGRLANDCRGVSEQLQLILVRLKLEQGDPKWKAVQVAFRSTRAKSEMEGIRKNLGEFRSQILLRLTLILNDRTTTVQSNLGILQVQSDERSRKTLRELNKLNSEVLSGVEHSIRAGCDVLSEKLEQQLDQVQHVRDEVQIMLRLINSPLAEKRILKGLYFPAMYSREDRIENAAKDTYGWILDDPDGELESGIGKGAQTIEVNDAYPPSRKHPDGNAKGAAAIYQTGRIEPFVAGQAKSLFYSQAEPRRQARFSLQDWLRHGEGVFHITGKAGSGKSTLMKFLVGHHRTRADLRAWSGKDRLVVAQFFFWMSGGDPLQKSLAGLYRSILFETLQQCPELVREVFPRAFEDFSSSTAEFSVDEVYFRLPELQRAMERLVSLRPQLGVRLCFFIDGLDEYSGDGVDRLEHEALARQLNSWAVGDDGPNGRPRVKFIVSSRPHAEFDTAFDGSDEGNRRIRLHELTALDILLYGDETFRNSSAFRKVESFYQTLLNTVVLRAKGVFIWARFAIRSLVTAARRRPEQDSLLRLLNDLPLELNALYTNLLASIQPIDRVMAFKLLLMVTGAGRRPFPAVVLEWLSEIGTADFPFSSVGWKLRIDYESPEVTSETAIRLNDLTGGLLELSMDVSSRFRPHFGPSIVFFHRTCRDFVLSNPELKMFKGILGEQAISNLSFQARLAMVCFTPPTISRRYAFWDDDFAEHIRSGPTGRHQVSRFKALQKALALHPVGPAEGTERPVTKSRVGNSPMGNDQKRRPIYRQQNTPILDTLVCLDGQS